MNTINACNIHNENANISDILIANETSPEYLSCQEITGDIMDSAVKISVDPIKVFQKAGLKFSDIVLEKYNTLSTNMNRLGVNELRELSPLQYPLFTEVKSENSSLLKTSLFIGSSLVFILFMRYRKKNVNNNCNTNDIQTIGKIKNINITTPKLDIVKDEDVVIISDNGGSSKISSRGIFTNWFGFNS